MATTPQLEIRGIKVHINQATLQALTELLLTEIHGTHKPIPHHRDQQHTAPTVEEMVFIVLAISLAAINMLKAAILVVAAIAFSTQAQSEVFFNIDYGDTLGELKKKFGGAKFEKIKPGWLTEKDAFFRISGIGLTAEFYVAFEDLRPGYKSSANANSDILKYLASQNDDDALTVEWVRIIYQSKVPLEIFSKKYGKPTKCEPDQSFSNMCYWPERNMEANMSDDNRFVLHATSGFTKPEKQLGYLNRGQVVPDWLR